MPPSIVAPTTAHVTKTATTTATAAVRTAAEICACAIVDFSRDIECSRAGRRRRHQSAATLRCAALVDSGSSRGAIERAFSPNAVASRRPTFFVFLLLPFAPSIVDGGGGINLLRKRARASSRSTTTTTAVAAAAATVVASFIKMRSFWAEATAATTAAATA